MRSATFLSLVILISARAVSAEPVLFQGKYYDAIATPGLTWTQARDLAAARVFQGKLGHLATANTIEENDFLVSIHPVQSGGCWIGGFQDPEAPEPDGGWRWVIDESFSVDRWTPGNPGEPNDFGGGEDYLELYSPPAGTWNDRTNGPHAPVAGYIVEYGTQSAVPAVSTWGLLSFSFIVLAAGSVICIRRDRSVASS